MYPCDYVLPENKTIDGFTDLFNVTCSDCRETCEPPVVDSSVGFFDGFDWNEMALTVLWDSIFSITFELLKFKFVTPSATE